MDISKCNGDIGVHLQGSVCNWYGPKLSTIQPQIKKYIYLTLSIILILIFPGESVYKHIKQWLWLQNHWGGQFLPVSMAAWHGHLVPNQHEHTCLSLSNFCPSEVICKDSEPLYQFWKYPLCPPIKTVMGEEVFSKCNPNIFVTQELIQNFRTKW